MKAMTGKYAGRLSVILIASMLLSILLPAFAAGKGPVEPITISSFTDRAGSININAGKAEGIVVGAKGAVIRDGKVIAEYEVEQVNWGISRIKLSNVVEGYTVRVGDSAPITSTPNSSSQQSKDKKKSSKSKLMWLAAAAGVVAIYFLTKGHHSSDSNSAYNITLDASKTTKYDGTDSSTITVTTTIKDANGNYAPDGTAVAFSATSGTLNRTTGTTSQGKAVVTLTGSSSDGTGVITVSAIGKTATLNYSFVASIDFTATPDTIQVVNSGGTQTVTTLAATCYDAYGNFATDGEVTFDTSLGTLGSASVNIVNGVATTTLTSQTAGTATVTANWGSTGKAISVKVTSGPPYAIAVASSSSSVQCDGNSFATITATVTDVAGNKATDGTVVKFSVTPDGTGGGNGSITAQATTTNGEAKASLFTRDATGATSKSGTATVNVQVLVADQPSTVPAPAADITNSATKVQFTSIEVAEIHLSASPTNIRGWDVANNKTTITAVVYNADHAPVPNGTAVTFTANHGLITAGSTTTDGIATTSLVSDASGSASWNGLVDVTATSGGVSATGTGLVVFSGWPSPLQCSANISQATLAKSGGQASITVQAMDINGNPIVDDTTVTAITSKGTVSPSSGKTSGGTVAFTLATSTDATNPTESGAGTVTITIPSGGNNPETGGLPVTLTVNFTVSP